MPCNTTLLDPKGLSFHSIYVGVLSRTIIKKPNHHAKSKNNYHNNYLSEFKKYTVEINVWHDGIIERLYKAFHRNTYTHTLGHITKSGKEN